MKKLLLISAAVTALMASCSTPKNITYFQDTEQADGAEIVQRTEIRLQPGDRGELPDLEKGKLPRQDHPFDPRRF